MNWKDTVKPTEEHSESIWCPHCEEEFGIEGNIEYARKTQAEISFKTGVEEGWKQAQTFYQIDTWML